MIPSGFESPFVELSFYRRAGDTGEHLRQLCDFFDAETPASNATEGRVVIYMRGEPEDAILKVSKCKKPEQGKQPGVISYWLSGAEFSMPNPLESLSTRERGKRLAYAMGTAADSTKSDYAGISIDWALECPETLANDPRSNALYNCYVSDALFRASGLRGENIVRHNGVVEHLRHGWLLLLDSIWNGGAVVTQREFAHRTSVVLGETIGAFFAVH